MWASSNLKSDAFLLVYDITNRESLDVLGEFVDLIEIEREMRGDEWERSQRSNSGKRSKFANGGQIGPVQPIKIVAGNKCDLQESRQVSAQMGLEWARKRGCGFMETSARNTVNIEETFALIIRRVVEARKEAMGLGAGAGFDAQGRNRGLGAGTVEMGMGTGTRRAVTAPLSPLPGGPEKELGMAGVARGQGGKKRRFGNFWRRLACWR